MAEKKYRVMYGDSWSGKRTYWFEHGGKILFSSESFHSADHAKQEALEHLSALGIEVTIEEIGLDWDGCL